MSSEKENERNKYALLILVFILGFALGGSLFLLLGNDDQQKENIFYSPDTDLARNDGTFKYPSPMESDKGWGGAIFPWHLVDGIRERGNYWAYGLAFTGGKENYEDSCGWRQATIDFGEPRAFNRVVIWHAGDNLDIPEYFIRSWNKKLKQWDTLVCKKDIVRRTNPIKEKDKTRNSIPSEDVFPTVVSNKVQFYFNNCKGSHGWINEFEVYYDRPGDRPECLVVQPE